MKSLTTKIRREAKRIGFELVGFAPAMSPPGFSDFQQWLQRGFAGEMTWMNRREAAYEHPESVMTNVRSVIMLAINYRTTEPTDPQPHEGRVSCYAWGSHDYHNVLRDKLKALAEYIHERRPECRTRGIVDTAPLLERDFARLAGLGWFGKNTVLINKHAGSWLFLAAMLTDLELQYDQSHTASHCGTCTRCLDACPTNAFPEPFVLDARRCISYLNIELRNAPIPRELRAGMQDWLFGCDICQDVCPWNRMAGESTEPAFQPQKSRNPADCVALLTMTEEEFDANFQSSPLARPQRAGLLRNAAVVLGNAGDRTVVPALVSAMSDDEPLVRGACAWALGEIGGTAAIEALTSRLKREKDGGVLSEIRTALERSSETSG